MLAGKVRRMAWQPLVAQVRAFSSKPPVRVFFNDSDNMPAVQFEHGVNIGQIRKFLLAEGGGLKLKGDGNSIVLNDKNGFQGGDYVFIGFYRPQAQTQSQPQSQPQAQPQSQSSQYQAPQSQSRQSRPQNYQQIQNIPPFTANNAYNQQNTIPQPQNFPPQTPNFPSQAQNFSSQAQSFQQPTFSNQPFQQTSQIPQNTQSGFTSQPAYPQAPQNRQNITYPQQSYPPQQQQPPAPIPQNNFASNSYGFYDTVQQSSPSPQNISPQKKTLAEELEIDKDELEMFPWLVDETGQKPF